jgi:predicted nucleic acid-binding protein
LSTDLAASLRRIKPDKRRKQITTRIKAELISAADFAGTGRSALLIDTNVYIQSAAGTLPATAELLVDSGLLFHCSVCMAELAIGIANADPQHPGWRANRDYYDMLIAGLPPARVLTPDAAIWTEAGVIAGTLARCQGYQRHQRKESLNDALIYLTAAKAGLPVLTANRNEFDLIQQLAPQGQFIYF